MHEGSEAERKCTIDDVSQAEDDVKTVGRDMRTGAGCNRQPVKLVT
jgi:hypothetical protein